MCPDVQLLSIYKDDELPSPWKEKLESHLNECSDCREKLSAFNKFIEKPADSEQAIMEAAKDRVWQNLQSRRRFQPRAVNAGNSSRIWQRRGSIPLPAAAAAAIIIALVTVMWLRSGQISNNGLANDPYGRAGFLIAADEEEIPGIMPAAGISGVLQYLNTDSADIIILQLPESKSFSRTGEPAILRAADYNEDQMNSGSRRGSRNRRQQ